MQDVHSETYAMTMCFHLSAHLLCCVKTVELVTKQSAVNTRL